MWTCQIVSWVITKQHDVLPFFLDKISSLVKELHTEEQERKYSIRVELKFVDCWQNNDLVLKHVVHCVISEGRNLEPHNWCYSSYLVWSWRVEELNDWFNVINLVNYLQCRAVVFTHVGHFIYKHESNKNFESVMKIILCAAAGTAHCQCWLVRLIHVCIVVIVCALNCVWCHYTLTNMFCAS